MRIGAGIVGAALACVVATSARARPLADALEVTADDSCLSRDALAQAVSTWLEAAELDDRIRVVVKSEGDPPANVSFVLEKDGKPAAFRQFLQPPKECSDRRAVVALSIAMAIDNTLLKSLGVEPEPAARPTPKPEPTPNPKPKPKPKPPILRKPSVGVDAFAEAFGALRLLPDPAFGGLLGLDARWAFGLELRLGAMATAPTNVSIASAEAELQLAAVRFDGCFRQDVAPLQVRSCAGAATGHVVAEGVGFDRDFGVALPWSALAGRLDLLLPLGGGVSASLGLDGTLPLVRSKIRVIDASGSDVATRVMPAAGIATVVGARIALPR